MIRHIEEDDKKDLLRRMRTLSSEISELVIIAGTVAWRRPFDGPDTATRPRRVEKTKTAVKQLADLMSGNLGAVSDKLDLLKQVGKEGGPVYLAKNTAYVLYKGNVLLRYHKRSDFHEVRAYGSVYEPGMREGRFEVSTNEPRPRTIKFGLEICLDHHLGALASMPGEVDVHVISSASIGFNRINAVTKPNGYLVHADCDRRHCEVLRREVVHMPAQRPGGIPNSGEDSRVSNSHEILSEFALPQRDPVALTPLQFYELTLNSVPDASPVTSSSQVTPAILQELLPLPMASQPLPITQEALLSLPPTRMSPMTLLSSPMASRPLPITQEALQSLLPTRMSPMTLLSSPMASQPLPITQEALLSLPPTRMPPMTSPSLQPPRPQSQPTSQPHKRSRVAGENIADNGGKKTRFAVGKSC